MFLGAIVFLILALSAGVIVLRGIHWLVSGPARKEKAPGHKEQKEEKKASGKQETQTPSKTQETAQQEEVPEQTRRRYAASIEAGITEVFFSGETDFRIDGKALADECVSLSALSYLEYNNRSLAGKEFHGFNLIVEEGSRMVLTYDGSAVASLTRTEKETTAVINGKTVVGTMPCWRTNTFPPRVKEGTVVGDIERMLSAAEAVSACAGDPAMVSQAMVGQFTEGDNVTELKSAIDRKIQSKESAEKGMKRSQERPRRLSLR